MADQYGHRDNNDRADAARAALDAYIATNTTHYASEPIEDQVGDLLCDLLHLVRREGVTAILHEDQVIIGPTQLLDRARSNFEAEEEEEDGGEEGTEDEEEEHPDTDSLEDRGLTLGSYGS